MLKSEFDDLDRLVNGITTVVCHGEYSHERVLAELDAWPKLEGEKFAVLLQSLRVLRDDLRSKYFAVDPGMKNYTIPAELEPDDMAILVCFDAVNWFIDTDDHTIRRLALSDWGHDFDLPPPTALVEFMSRCNARVGLVMDYIRLEAAKPNYDCRVSKAAAMRWLEIYRRPLFLELQAIENAKYATEETKTS